MRLSLTAFLRPWKMSHDHCTLCMYRSNRHSNPSRTVHCVRLFLKKSCTCPVGTVCCHILAAKHSIGLTSSQERHVNLGQLRRNFRKRCDKKSGRKQPRKGDITFTWLVPGWVISAQLWLTVNNNCCGWCAVTAAECVTGTPNTTPKLKSKKQVRFNSPLEQTLVTSVDAQQSTPIAASIDRRWSWIWIMPMMNAVA